MPDRLDDGTFVYPTMRQAINYAEMGGFDIIREPNQPVFASRGDMQSYFELVEVKGPYLNYVWKRV